MQPMPNIINRGANAMANNMSNPMNSNNINMTMGTYFIFMSLTSSNNFLVNIFVRW